MHADQPEREKGAAPPRAGEEEPRPGESRKSAPRSSKNASGAASVTISASRCWRCRTRPCPRSCPPYPCGRFSPDHPDCPASLSPANQRAWAAASFTSWSILRYSGGVARQRWDLAPAQLPSNRIASNRRVPRWQLRPLGLLVAPASAEGTATAGWLSLLAAGGTETPNCPRTSAVTRCAGPGRAPAAARLPKTMTPDTARRS